MHAPPVLTTCNIGMYLSAVAAILALFFAAECNAYAVVGDPHYIETGACEVSECAGTRDSDRPSGRWRTRVSMPTRRRSFTPWT